MAGRIRSIKPELLDDEIAAGLSDAAWRLFVSSWLLADDQGGFRASPRYLAALVWQDTHRDALTPLLELADKGRVLLYEADGQLYAMVPTWARHQRVDNAGKPRVPNPPTNIREVSANLAESLRGSRRAVKTSPPDQRPRSPTTDPDHETKRNVGFENPPPSGAGPSAPASLEPLAPVINPGDLAPVAPAARAPVPGPAEPSESTFGAAPALPQPEPPADAQPAVLAPVAAHEAPTPATMAPVQSALPLALGSPVRRLDPVESIFAEYLAAWKRTMKGRRAPVLDGKRRRLTVARLRQFTEDDLKAAARGIFASEWHVRERETSYDLVMRDSAHVERFMALDPGPVRDVGPYSEPPPPPMRAAIAAVKVERVASSVEDVKAILRGEAWPR